MLFLKKSFYGRLGKLVRVNLLGKLIRGYFAVLHGELIIRSCQGQVSFTNALSNNLKTLNVKVFSNHEGICT